jgi:hypothetical protein
MLLLRKLQKTRSKLHLDFNELACAHILLQMNSIQNLFEFQILTANDVYKMTNSTIAIRDISIITEGIRIVQFGHEMHQSEQDKTHQSEQDKTHQSEQDKIPPLGQWFITFVLSELEKPKTGSQDYWIDSPDYWIGITSDNIEGYFAWTDNAKKLDKKISIITSELWEKKFSPPSVFEYIVITTFKCALRSLFLDFLPVFKDHNETRGCIFDRTALEKPYRRISVTNPNLCSNCKKTIQKLETTIQNQSAASKFLYRPISKVLSKKWLGSLKEENSPIYNLKKNYGYSVDINSGFYKGPFRKSPPYVEN